ncbi:MAG: metallophosphoesterase [Bacteroidota bacterium]
MTHRKERFHIMTFNKSFISSVFGGLLLLLPSVSAFLPAQHIRHQPHLSCVTQHSMTIAWTSTDSVETKILWRPLVGKWKEAVIPGKRLAHSYVLEGLLPSTSYQYRVVAGNDTTEQYAFMTAVKQNEPFSFAAYGDTRSNRDAHVSVLRAMKEKNPKLIVNTGDLVAKSANELWDDYFEDICSKTGVGQNIPVYSSPGNHEKGAMYFENVLMPHNNPANSPAYYSFDYGNVHFISLNSEIPYDSLSEQYQWLLNDLRSEATKKAAFKIAFWHRPPYSSSIHGSDLNTRSVLCPVLEAHGVDIVFNGHDHVYERTKAVNGTTYVVTGGGGAPLYDFKTENEWTAYKEKNYHFCLLNVEGKRLKMLMIRPDGEVRDSLIIVKP